MRSRSNNKILLSGEIVIEVAASYCIKSNSARLVAKDRKYETVIYLFFVQSPKAGEEFQLQAITLVQEAVLTPLQSTKAFDSISERIASSKIAASRKNQLASTWLETEVI